jgi:hypothetical protein
VTALGNNINTTEKNAETLIEDIKGVGLEVNVEKSKYMLLSRQQNAGQNHDIQIVNRSFENVARLKHFGTTITKFDSRGI